MEQRENRDWDRAVPHAGHLGQPGGSLAEAQAVGFLRSLPPTERVRTVQQVTTSNTICHSDAPSLQLI